MQMLLFFIAVGPDLVHWHPSTLGPSPHPWHWEEAAGNSARIGSIGLGGRPWVQAGYIAQQRLENIAAPTSGASSTSASGAVGRSAGSGCWIGLRQRCRQRPHRSGKLGPVLIHRTALEPVHWCPLSAIPCSVSTVCNSIPTLAGLQRNLLYPWHPFLGRHASVHRPRARSQAQKLCWATVSLASATGTVGTDV